MAVLMPTSIRSDRLLVSPAEPQAGEPSGKWQDRGFWYRVENQGMHLLWEGQGTRGTNLHEMSDKDSGSTLSALCGPARVDQEGLWDVQSPGRMTADRISRPTILTSPSTVTVMDEVFCSR